MRTKKEHADWKNPNLNKLWSIIALIEEYQDLGLDSRDFTPPMVCHKDVKAYLEGAPYQFAVSNTNLPNNQISITKITWV